MITRWDVDYEATCMFNCSVKLLAPLWRNCSDGDYVLFDDYDNLCREFDDLKEKYDRLVGKLGDLYREA